MTDAEKYVPQWIKIRSYLQTLISSMKVGDLIPSEIELSKQFNVSRGTVKQAITSLVHDGYLQRKQGKGTFVAAPVINRNYRRLPSFSEDIKKISSNFRSVVLRFGTVTPPEEVKCFFSLGDDGRKVLRFKRLYIVDEDPIVIVTSYLDPTMYPNLKKSDIKNSLYKDLDRIYGKIPTKAHDTYSITHARGKTAELLNCKEGDPIFYSERKAYLADDTPAEFVESFIRSDRFKLDLSIGFNEVKTPASDEPTRTIATGGNLSELHYGTGFRNIIFESNVIK